MATVAVQTPRAMPAQRRQEHRFSVDQYDRMVEAGILTGNDRVELLEGRIVDKMPQDPPHATSIELVRSVLQSHLPAGWQARDQKPIRTTDSRPEPDVAVVSGPVRRFARQHPAPADVAMVIEVADTTLTDDREAKGRIYARARIPIYWIVNLPESKVEVYTQPRAGRTPGYRQRRDFGRNDSVPLVIEGRVIAHVPVSDVLPE